MDPLKTDEQVLSRSYGISVLEYETTMPTKFMYLFFPIYSTSGTGKILIYFPQVWHRYGYGVLV